jgi:hypothetical protein
LGHYAFGPKWKCLVFCPQWGGNWPFFLIQLCSFYVLKVWMRLASQFGLGKQCSMEIMSELETFDSWPYYFTQTQWSLAWWLSSHIHPLSQSFGWFSLCFRWIYMT